MNDITPPPVRNHIKLHTTIKRSGQVVNHQPEDAIENNRTIIVIGSNDKEKYFDCTILEHQCAAMLIACCPPPLKSFIEMKVEDLHNRQVHINTDVGTIQAVVLCGYPQESGSTCVCSNFIDALEVKMWGLPLILPHP